MRQQKTTKKSSNQTPAQKKAYAYKPYAEIAFNENVVNDRRGSVPDDADIVDIRQQSELGEVLDKAYTKSDIFDEESSISTIDFWSRIPRFNESFIIRFEAAAQIGLIPRASTAITRAAKRNYVSRDGLGRKEAVAIIAGKRDHDIDAGSTWGSMKNWFSSRFTGRNDR